MKTIIAGSRDKVDYDDVCQAMMDCDWRPSEIVSGGARGVDRLGERWGFENKVPVRRFIPNWRPSGVFDKGAGHARNRKMGDYAQALVAIWDGQSPGTKGMIDYARKNGLRVFVYKV